MDGVPRPGGRPGRGSLAIDPAPPSTVYAGSQGGLFRTANRAKIWTEIDSGLSALKVYALAVDPANPSMLYVGTEIGLFKSADGDGPAICERNDAIASSCSIQTEPRCRGV